MTTGKRPRVSPEHREILSLPVTVRHEVPPKVFSVDTSRVFIGYLVSQVPATFIENPELPDSCDGN